MFHTEEHMSKSKSKPSSAIEKESKTNSANKQSYLMMYSLAVVMLLIACLVFYAHATASKSTTPLLVDERSHSHRRAHSAACGNKDLWRAKNKTTAQGESNKPPADLTAPASWGSLRPGVYFGKESRQKSLPILRMNKM